MDNTADTNATLMTIAGANGAFSLVTGDLGYLGSAGEVPAWCANVQSKLGANVVTQIFFSLTN